MTAGFLEQEVSGVFIETWTPQLGEGKYRLGLSLAIKNYTETTDNRRHVVDGASIAFGDRFDWNIAAGVKGVTSLFGGFADYDRHASGYKGPGNIHGGDYWFVDLRDGIQLTPPAAPRPDDERPTFYDFSAEIGVGLKWNIFGDSAARMAGDTLLPEQAVYPYLASACRF